MSFTNTNDYLVGRKPVVTPSASEDVTVRGSINLLTGDLTLNNTGGVMILPAGCVPVRLVVDSDDLDSGGAPAVVFAVGALNAAGNDLSSAAVDGGAAWGTGLTVAQTGGAVTPVSTALMRVLPASADRVVGLKVTTAPATPVAGQVGITMTYRAA